MKLTFREDSRGAIFILGLFLCLFLITFLYGVLHLTQTLLFRESIQDATDAAALSASIFHARGMNLIVYLNLLMSALIAVLIALRLVQSLFLLASFILYGLAWPTWGATLPFASLATQQANHFSQTYKSTKQLIDPLLIGLHRTQEVIATVIPPLALLDNLRGTVQSQHPQALVLALPSSSSLPIEADEFPRLCEKGAEHVARVALLPLEALGAGSWLGSIRETVGDLAYQLADYLCGDGSSAPPTHVEKIESSYPRPPSAHACSQLGPSTPACAEYEKLLRDSAPDPHTGECRPSTNCQQFGPYYRMAQLARQQCEPTAHFLPHRWFWQKTVAQVTLQAQEISGQLLWKEAQRPLTQVTLLETDQAPCGPEGSIHQGWNLLLEDASGEALPLCSQYYAPPYSPSHSQPLLLLPPEEGGATLSVVLVEASQLLSCSYWEKHSVDLASPEDLLGDRGEDKAPHRVEEDLQLGEEVFQIRALTYAAPPKLRNYERLARWINPQEHSPSSPLLWLAGLSFAQAEYYLDHSGELGPEEWLWTPRWTARLKRFRYNPSKQQEEKHKQLSRYQRSLSWSNGSSLLPFQENLGEACALFSFSECERVEQALPLLNEFILH